MTAWEPSPARPFDRLDLHIAAIVFAIASLVAALYLPAFRASGGKGAFYQEEFGAAVMSACGRGYVLAVDPPPSLTSFLARDTDRFDCADLPRDMRSGGTSIMQGAFKYLMMSAALVWRVTGVRWNAIDIILIAMFATGVTAAYLALRFVSGRTLSVIGTLAWMTSPMHLGNLPHLRDYSKAPFFVLTLVAVGFVIRERRGWALAAAGAIFGLVTGIGFGMRTDVILNLAPFLIALFAAGSRAVREQMVPKLTAAVLALAAFTIVAWPILTAYGESEGVTHVALLGLTTPFDERLSVRAAPYDFGAFYNDSFVSAQVRGDWQRAHATGPVPASAIPYPAASRNYYLKLATTFPGDFMTRMAGSVIETLNLPFSITYGYVPAGVTSGILTTLGTWRARFILAFIGCGVFVALTLLVLIGISSLRDEIVGFALLLFWTAYPFIQFHGRHTFHLEFLVIAGCLALLSLIWRSVQQLRRGARPEFRAVARSAGLAGAMLLAIVVTMLGARGVQALEVERLLGGYDAAQTVPVAAPAALFRPPGRELAAQQVLIVVDIARTGCARPPDAVTFRYPPDPDGDFTRRVEVPTRPMRIFAPVYGLDLPRRTAVRFAGIEAPPESAGCIQVSQVRGVDQLLWMDARLTPDWRQKPLHQKLYLGPAFPERLWLKLAHWWPGISNLG